MNSISTNINLLILIKSLDDYIILEKNKLKNFKFISSNRVSLFFLDELLKQPIVLYLEKNSLQANTQIDDNHVISILHKVHHSPQYIVLLYIYYTFKNQEIEDKYINCILVETNKFVAKSEPLHTLIYLDYLLSRKNETNNSGKIDFKILEDKFHKIYSKSDYQKLLKKPGKYFYQLLLSLNLYR